MWNILVPVEDNDGFPSVSACARLLRHHLDGWIKACPLHSDVHPMSAMAAGMGGLAMRTEDLVRDHPGPAAAKALFERTLRAFPKGLTGEPRCTFSERDMGDEDLGQWAKLFDVVVLGQPSGSPGGPRQSTIEAVLFESGRPLVIAPPDIPESLGNVIVIAWNGSTETARTIGFAAPLLARAARVIVLSVDGGMVPGPSGGDVAAALRRRGVKAEARHLACERDPGQTILSACCQLGADLLLKGAYTRSRLRQLIFGGATQHIINNARLPVLMAH